MARSVQIRHENGMAEMCCDKCGTWRPARERRGEFKCSTQYCAPCRQILNGCGRSKVCNREQINLRFRYRIFERDNFTCQYCGRRAPEVELVPDYMIPVAKGGTLEAHA